MADRNICDVGLLNSISKNTNVIVSENGVLNKLNLYNEINAIDTKIDNGLSTVSESVSQLSNPNLLINSDFRNPINQRGQTIYYGSSSHIYTIDRWRLDSSSDLRTVEVLDGCIRLQNNHATYNTTFRQQLEKSLPSGYYTLTVKVKSLNGTMTARVGGTTINLVEGMNYVTINGTVDYVYIGMYVNSSIEIEYIKLEQGSMATPFVPRPYAEEFAMCQRYYRKLAGDWYTMYGAQVIDSTKVVYDPHIEDMRIVPSVFVTPMVCALTNNANKPTVNLNISSVGFMYKGLQFTVATAHSMIIGSTCSVSLGATGSYVAFDAEIY